VRHSQAERVIEHLGEANCFPSAGHSPVEFAALGKRPRPKGVGTRGRKAGEAVALVNEIAFQ
jgi:hypothetical protein